MSALCRLLALVAALAPLSAAAGAAGQTSSGPRVEVFLGPGQVFPPGLRRLRELAAADGGETQVWRLRDLGKLRTLDPSAVPERRDLQGFARALGLGVERVPAVVLDGGEPLYGAFDAAEAYSRRSEQRGQQDPAAELGRAVAGAGEASFSLRTLASAWVEGLRSPDCLDYCVTGTCLYLQCGLLGCSVAAMPKVRHRLPDLVVSSWSGSGHPWRELRAPMKLLTESLGLSSGAADRSRIRGSKAASFREADVLANPMLALAVPGLCRARSAPWQPHYSSLLDSSLWRSGLSELLLADSWNLSAWNLGSDKDRWGHLFPRKGFGHFRDPARGALVTALRALDIAEMGGLHLRLPIRSGSGRRDSARHPPGRPGRTGGDNCWQQLHPVRSASCQSAAVPEPPGQPAYAWQVWTHYECCLPAPGRLIQTLSFQPLCLK